MGGRSTSEPWYRDGLRFTCTRCGNCCTGAPGYVWVTESELQSLAGLLEQPAEVVRGLYTRTEDGRVTLRERPNGDCVFWDRERGCTVYSARPVQCRTWPFWESTVTTPEDWKETQRGCPGAGRGELITADEITRRVRALRI